MKKTAFVAAALLALPFAAQAQEMTPYNVMPAGVYASDPYHTSLNWKVLHMGLSHYTARFKKIAATLTYDPKDVTKSKLVATIDPASIETDYVPDAQHDFNKELSTDEKWFNDKKFPSIKFESTKIEVTDKDHGKIYGNLTLLGVTKPIILDTTFNGAYAMHPFTKKAMLGFSAKATIKRSDWGFSTFVPMIGDDVDLLIETEFDKQS